MILLFQCVFNNMLKILENLKCFLSFLSDCCYLSKIANTFLPLFFTANLRIFFGKMDVISQVFSLSIE